MACRWSSVPETQSFIVQKKCNCAEPEKVHSCACGVQETVWLCWSQLDATSSHCVLTFTNLHSTSSSLHSNYTSLTCQPWRCVCRVVSVMSTQIVLFTFKIHVVIRVRTYTEVLCVFYEVLISSLSFRHSCVCVKWITQLWRIFINIEKWKNIQNIARCHNESHALDMFCLTVYNTNKNVFNWRLKLLSPRAESCRYNLPWNSRPTDGAVTLKARQATSGSCDVAPSVNLGS